VSRRSANTAAVTSNAYSAGLVAGQRHTASVYNAASLRSAPPPPPKCRRCAASAPTGVYAMGGIYPTLPAGCISPTVQGMTYYLCRQHVVAAVLWRDGVSYRVVPTP